MKPVVLALWAFVVFSSASAGAEEVWKITSLNWEPYSGASLAHQGGAIQKLRELLKKEGIRLLVEFYPWSRAQARARSGEYVGYFPAWPEEVGSDFVASPPVSWSEVAVMKNTSGAFSYDGLDALFRTHVVGVVKTYAYPRPVSDAMAAYPHHVDGAPNDMSLLKKLARGRHMVAVTDPNVMMFLAEREGIDNITPMAVVVKRELVVAFRNDTENRARLALLTRLLEEASAKDAKDKKKE